jgi:hypothetical protein
LVAAVGCAVLLSGCGDEKTAPSLCRGGRTAPLTKQQVKAALLRHGIKLYEESDSELCSASDVRVDLTNYETTADQEGLIDCILRVAPIYAWPLAIQETPGYKIEYVLANSECSIYPKGSRGKEQARNLTAALSELERDRGLKR